MWNAEVDLTGEACTVRTIRLPTVYFHPSVWHPRVENLDYAQIADSLKTARAAIAGMVAHLPTHEEFLQSVQAG